MDWPPCATKQYLLVQAPVQNPGHPSVLYSHFLGLAHCFPKHNQPMNIAGFRESSRSKKIACAQASPIPWTLRPLSSFRGLGRAIYFDLTFNFQNSYKDSTRNFCILFCRLFTYTSFFHLKVGWKHFSVYFLRTKTFAYISRVALWEWRDIIFVEYYYLIQSLC